MSAMLLKLAKDDPQRELDFELDFLLSLTVRQRFEMMKRRSRELMRILIRRGHRELFEIIKRPLQ